ncbi:MAG TPA: hypothetical protein DDZ88_17170, partial [Verrucomicrobiales bacterium]|nr:hypothetical protein [Verrucomicrobiales bacterium]
MADLYQIVAEPDKMLTFWVSAVTCAMSDALSIFEARVTAYDAWYQAPRGRWIGETEFALLKRMFSVASRAAAVTRRAH